MTQIVQLASLSSAHLGLVFAFQWYVIAVLGPGGQTDALFAGMTVPQIALAVVGGSLVHVLVPLLAGEDPQTQRHDSWAFLTAVTILFGLAALVLYSLAPWWVPLLFPGFDESVRSLTVDLTRIQVIGMTFAAISGVQSATYHARQQFLWAEAVPVLASMIAMGGLILALPKFGVIAAAWIATLRMVVQTVLLAPGMGWPVRPDLRTAAMRTASQRLKPLLLGTTYYKTDPVVDRYLLSSAASGSLTLYYLAQQVFSAGSQIMSRAIAAPLVPTLTRFYKSGEAAAFRRTYRAELLRVGVLSSAGIIALVLFGRPLLPLVALYGGVAADDVMTLWWIMALLGGMFIGAATGQVASSAFYACGDTRTPTRMTVMTYTAYIPIKVLAFHLWGIAGLAISTSVYYIGNLSLQTYLLHRKVL